MCLSDPSDYRSKKNAIVLPPALVLTLADHGPTDREKPKRIFKSYHLDYSSPFFFLSYTNKNGLRTCTCAASFKLDVQNNIGA